MLIGLKPIPEQGASASEPRDASRFRATFLVVSLVFACCLHAKPAFGQSAFASERRDKSDKASPAPDDDTATTSSVPFSWGQSLDWSPHKPSLTVESDCFLNVELELAFPHLGSQLSSPPVTLGNSGPVKTVFLRNAHLDTTVSPLFEIGGFRFGPGYGDIALSYRFLATDGKDFIPALDPSGAGEIRSRLNLQVFDLDYKGNPCALGWDTFLSWQVGGRFQVVFFDTQAQTATSFEQARNYFFGGGAHTGFTVTRPLPGRWGLYSHFDAGFLGAYNTAQNFVASTVDPQNGFLFGSASQQQSQFAPSLSVQAGFSWTPTRLPSSRLRGGYQFDQWYNLGRVDDSRGDLSAHGVFVNWEWSF
jgi:hypothetical protein